MNVYPRPDALSVLAARLNALPTQPLRSLTLDRIGSDLRELGNTLHPIQQLHLHSNPLLAPSLVTTMVQVSSDILTRTFIIHSHLWEEEDVFSYYFVVYRSNAVQLCAH